MKLSFNPQEHCNLFINSILVHDSRHVQLTEKSMFIAIKGQNHDGHRFIDDMYKAGIRRFLVNTNAGIEADNYPNADFYCCTNTIRALQEVAALHRRNFQIPLVAVTGSNGKTIVKEWLYQLLQPEYSVVKSPKSYNSQIGVPLSVLQMASYHQVAVFEAGISQPGEMEHLENVLQPELGIFTNIGTAHDAGFTGREQKIAEKFKLFERCKALICRVDQPEVRQWLQHWRHAKHLELYTWGTHPEARFRILELFAQNGLMHCTLSEGHAPVKLEMPFIDAASVENLLHCVLALRYLGQSWEQIKQRIAGQLATARVAMRLELKKGQHDCIIIDDSYNNDLAGLSLALDFQEQQNQFRHRQKSKTLILSDVLQSGLPSRQLYSHIASLLQQKGVDKLIGIGPAMCIHAALFTLPKTFFFPDRQAFINELHKGDTLSFGQESILVKGARVFGFEHIVSQLQEKSHQTTLEINLDALAHNFNYYRSQLAQGVKTMVMVKAFAYGSGSDEVANLLQHRHADYLAVAYADEGVRLRNNGVTLPIMIMNPAPEAFDVLHRYRLEPELYSFRLLKEWICYVQSQEPASLPSVHLKIDTGMRRLGFESEEVDELCHTIGQYHNRLRIASVFTHLAGADSEQFNDFSLHQLGLFEQAVHALKQVISEPFLRHALNSAGILRFPAHHYDMVRLGIGLYGIEANREQQAHLQTVCTLKTYISQIKYLRAGETVGYSRKGQVSRDSTIATIAIGYADGLDRRLSNGNGYVMVNGTTCPVIGNICMDMTMIDITHAQAQEGDEVIVFGDRPHLNQIADAIATIPYELMTGIGERVKRVFYSR